MDVADGVLGIAWNFSANEDAVNLERLCRSRSRNALKDHRCNLSDRYLSLIQIKGCNVLGT